MSRAYYREPKRRCEKCNVEIVNNGVWARYPIHQREDGTIQFIYLCRECNKTHTFDKRGDVVAWAR